MAKTVEDQMISDAIKGTEQEIFADATGGELPDTEAGEQGDRSIEEMGDGLEGQHEDDADGSEGDEGNDDAEDEDGDEPVRDPKTGQFKAKEGEGADDAGKPGAKDGEGGDDGKAAARIPPGRLREEADKRRALEAELETERASKKAVEDQVGALSKRLDELMTTIATGKLAAPLQQAQQPAKKEDDDPKPDMFVDPEGYEAWQERRVERRIAAVEQKREVDRVELSMQIAHSQAGPAFEEAYAAVTKLNPGDPVARQTVQRIWGSPNPGKALVSWYNQTKTLAEVGDNPTAYREKVAQETREALLKDPEFRKQMLADLRAEAEGDGNGSGKARHVTRTPSLNGARGGAMGHVPDRRVQGNSDSDVFEFATSNN